MRTDIYLEPAQIPLGYCRAAGKLGVTLLDRCHHNSSLYGIGARA
jgi:hypothetical protein